MKCPVCGTESNHIFNGKLMQKYTVGYYQCPECAFVFTEPPYWLEEAYESAIVDVDTGLMLRNVDNVLLTNMLVKRCFNIEGTFLDWGGGYGIFCRMMRDLGYNWLWYDKYSANYVARGFEFKNNCKIDLMTAFELFEHFDKPAEELATMFSISRNILFSTELYDDNFQFKMFDDWWYYAPQTGQHISFYSKKTLEYLAEANSLFYYKLNGCMHLFTEHKISKLTLGLLLNPKLKFLQYYYYHANRKNGLAVADMNMLIERNSTDAK